jgi:DNA-binding NarL/FixJ family response regulator
VYQPAAGLLFSLEDMIERKEKGSKMSATLVENVPQTAQSHREAGRFAVLLDTDPLMLEILARVLRTVDVITLGKNTSPDATLETIREERPDVFVVEVPAGDAAPAALECIREARRIAPEIKPIALVDASDRTAVAAAYAAGAYAAVSLRGQTGDLALAVRRALEPSA